MHDESMRVDTPMEWPDYVIGYKTKGGRVRWTDTRTGKRTYPSWVMKINPVVLMPEDLKIRKLEATPEQHILMRQLETQLSQNGYDADIRKEKGVKTPAAVTAIVTLTGCKRRAAYNKLVKLWQAGLITRMGAIHSVSGRPYRQVWIFDRG
jgi:hypothetical protein